MKNSGSAPLRVCVFGATPAAADWLARLADALPAGTRVDALAQAVADTATAAVRAAAAAHPGDDLIVLRAGTLLPPHWYPRLAAARGHAGVLVASPLDNVGTARAPLPSAQTSAAPAQAIDTLCYRHGRRLLLDWPGFSPLLSLWRGAALAELDPQKLCSHEAIGAACAPWRAVLLDHLYVADPGAALHGPAPPQPGTDVPLPSALGELREHVAAALQQPCDDAGAGYPGLDSRSVVLHVLHGWGGGAERFVRDLAAGDDDRHHLLLIARGNFDRRRYGETLELYDAAAMHTPLRCVRLSDPIASTRFAHRGYAAFLDSVLRDYGIDAVVVSSLIGHSLDALRTGRPTTWMIHDFYPLWPLLHRNLEDPALHLDAAQLREDLAAAGGGFEFVERDADFWLTLREQVADALLQIQARLIAPSRCALALFLKLQPRLTSLDQHVIAHGLAPWPAAESLPLPTPPARPRLRLVVLGRVRGGKASNLLQQLLPELSLHAELFLLGAGAEGRDFFGHADVHILLNYRRDELPELLARVAADAALIVPDLPETFSYTLSELNSLGIPAIATRLGALAERIEDGVDGFLASADPADLIATVRRLCADRNALAQVRAVLAQKPLRTVAQMRADHDALLPRVAHHAPRYALGEADAEVVGAGTYADELGQAQRLVAALRDDLKTRQRELEQRAEWGFTLNRQVERASDALKRLRTEFDARSAWAAALNQELQALRPQFEQVRDERDRMRASLSWRLTKPLRYAKRKLAALRTRTAFTVSRMRAVLHRTRGSLASRGLVGTVRRAVDEFRRSPALPAVPIATEPQDDVAPFCVPTSATPLVSIVIPVFNKIAYTSACLRSLAEHAGTVPFEVIVVDDDSSDATAERLACVEGIRVQRNAQNLGFVGSCNAGAALASGEYLAFLNNDTLVTPGWLEALMRCFDEQPDCGLAGAKLVYPDGRLQEAGGIVFNDGSAWNYGRFDSPADPRYNFRHEVDYCSGAAIVLRRDLFQQIGGFDARYAPAYYEDTDLAFAVRAAGKKVYYEPRAGVVHFEGITAGTDTGSGIKRHQAINQATFREKWQRELAGFPAPIASARQAAGAANRNARGWVLIIDAYTPTPDQDSGSLRMFNVMRLLREFGYRVSFLPHNRAHAGNYTEALQALGVEALYHPFVTTPVAWLRENGADLDAIVLSRHYIAVNYVGLARLYAPQAHLIFDTVDLHYLREQRAAELDGNSEQAQQAARTRAQELKLIRECDVSLVVSSAEKQLLARELPGTHVEILSNVHDVPGCRRDFAQRHDLVFVGGFQHPPNTDAVLWFIREVFPHVRAKLPEVNFHVVGSKAPAQILELAHDGVVVHGFLPDIVPLMDGCRISVAPLRYGAGVKGKVNMAMSYGLPVVATSCAVEGMHVRGETDEGGPDVLVADTPEAFADAVVRVYEDPALWQRLSDHGVTNVSQHFSFEAARQALRRIFDPEQASPQPRE